MHFKSHRSESRALTCKLQAQPDNTSPEPTKTLTSCFHRLNSTAISLCVKSLEFPFNKCHDQNNQAGSIFHSSWETVGVCAALDKKVYHQKRGLSAKQKQFVVFQMSLMSCTLCAVHNLVLLVCPPPSTTQIHYFEPLITSYLLHNTDSPSGVQWMTQWETKWMKWNIMSFTVKQPDGT